MLAGKKKYLLVDQVRCISAPKYAELSILALYDAIADDIELLRYLPDKHKKSSKISKSFIWTIIDALRPEFAKEAVSHARRVRMEMD